MSKKKKGRTTAPKIKQAKLVPADHWALHAVARFVEPSDDIAQLARRMLVTCEKNNGLAVAAPQVGHDIRLVVTSAGDAFINPSVAGRGVQLAVETEGCLSYPNRWWHVPRHTQVDVTAIDAFTGEPVGFAVLDHPLLARMWQHEVDHLDGLVLVNRFDEVPIAPTAVVPSADESWLDTQRRA